MLIISILTYLLLSLLITIRYFKELPLGKVILVFFNLVISINILVCECLSFLNQLNDPLLYLIVQFVLCALVFVIAILPKLGEIQDDIANLSLQSFFIEQNGLIFLVFVVLTLAGFFIIGNMGPINNIDSLHTHLPRIYYWLQHGSFKDWYTATKTQLAYPINISIQGLYLFLLGKSENLFFLIQWFSLVACLALIFETSILLGATKKQANFVLLMTLSFPVILLQTYSLQGDLFLAPLLLTSVFLIIYFIKTRSSFFLILSAIPIAISIGAKQTAILFLPVYIIVLLHLLINKYASLKVFSKVLLFLCLAFIIFSSLKFIQSFINEQTEQSSMFSSVVMPVGSDSTNIPAKGYVINSFRYIYQATSIEGLTGSLLIHALELKNLAFIWITKKLNLNLEVKAFIPPGEDIYFIYAEPPSLSENSAWFGPISLILLPLTIILVFVRKNKYLKKYLAYSLLLLVIFFGSLILMKGGWGPNRGRYLISPVLIFMPLTYVIVPKRKVWEVIVTLLFSMLSIYLIMSILVFNDTRSLVNQYKLVNITENYIDKIKVTNIINSLYRKGLYEITQDLTKTTPLKEPYLNSNYYGRLFYQDQSEIANIEFVNKFLKKDQPIYLMIDNSTLEYALFGINKTRDLYPVIGPSSVPHDAYLLVEKQYHQQPINLKLVGENENYSIYYVP